MNRRVQVLAAEALFRHALRSESKPRLEAAIALAAQADTSIIVTADQLDADPMLLNTQNGTVDLRAGTLRPHDPADRPSAGDDGVRPYFGDDLVVT